MSSQPAVSSYSSESSLRLLGKEGYKHLDLILTGCTSLSEDGGLQTCLELAQEEATCCLSGDRA